MVVPGGRSSTEAQERASCPLHFISTHSILTPLHPGTHHRSSRLCRPLARPEVRSNTVMVVPGGRDDTEAQEKASCPLHFISTHPILIQLHPKLIIDLIGPTDRWQDRARSQVRSSAAIVVPDGCNGTEVQEKASCPLHFNTRVCCGFLFCLLIAFRKAKSFFLFQCWFFFNRENGQGKKYIQPLAVHQVCCPRHRGEVDEPSIVQCLATRESAFQILQGSRGTILWPKEKFQMCNHWNQQKFHWKKEGGRCCDDEELDSWF